MLSGGCWSVAFVFCCMAVSAWAENYPVERLYQEQFGNAAALHGAPAPSPQFVQPTAYLPRGGCSSPIVGCAATPRCGNCRDCTYSTGGSNRPDVEYGQSRPLLDLAGCVVSLPKKVALWDRRIDNHNVSPQTVQQVARYLQYRNIQGAKIRVNQYAPIDEWRRLASNRNIRPAAKYTVGAARVARYCVMPGRLFGGDEYNPYTNTLSMYSDVPAIGIAESAFAGDVQNRPFPGAYSAVVGLPVVSFLHETRTTDETLQYLQQNGSAADVAATRRLLYARCGNQLFGELGKLAPNGTMMLQLGSVGAAHVAATRENARMLR